MKKIVTEIKNMFKTLARRILRDEINARCDEAIKINHAVIGAKTELYTVLNNKKATKAQMTEAIEKAMAQLNEAYTGIIFH